MHETTIDRICKLIKAKKIKESEFCASIGISQSTFSTWKKLNRAPKSDLIPPIATFFDVSENYILTGEELGDVYLSLAKEAQKNSIDPEDIAMAIKMIKEIRDSENKK